MTKTFYGTYKRTPSQDDDPLDAFVAPFHVGSRVFGKEGHEQRFENYLMTNEPGAVIDDVDDVDAGLVDTISEPVEAMTPLQKFLAFFR